MSKCKQMCTQNHAVPNANSCNQLETEYSSIFQEISKKNNKNSNQTLFLGQSDWLSVFRLRMQTAKNEWKLQLNNGQMIKVNWIVIIVIEIIRLRYACIVGKWF